MYLLTWIKWITLFGNTIMQRNGSEVWNIYYFFLTAFWTSWLSVYRHLHRRRSSSFGPLMTRMQCCRHHCPLCICPPEACPSVRRPNSVSGVHRLTRCPSPPSTSTPATPVQTNHIIYLHLTILLLHCLERGNWHILCL